jgi:hypothetical protein
VLCLINVSKNGVSEKEILGALDLSSEIFGQLLHWLGPLIVVKRGMICFQYDVCKEVVEFVYMPDSKMFEGVCLSLASYFEGHKQRKILNVRVLDELPWLLEKGHDFESLKDCLTNLDFFEAVIIIWIYYLEYIIWIYYLEYILDI